MLKRIIMASAVFLSLLVLSPQANAHVSTCTLAAYAPTIVAPKTLRAKARWYCPTPAHHDFNNVDVRIQYKKVLRFRKDQWYAIPPNNEYNTSAMQGSVYVMVRCANGSQTYRTQFLFTMYGTQGSRHHEKTSGETTKNCG